MRQTFSLKEKRQHFLAILWPILMTQLGFYAMVFFNTVMSGHAGANDLAGVAIGASLWMPLSTGITGILLALTPIVVQYMGAERRENVPFGRDARGNQGEPRVMRGHSILDDRESLVVPASR